MSRLAAQKEFVFMRALGEAGFAVPRAIAQSRHTVVMGLVDGVPLRSVRRVGDPAGLYAELMEVILRFAEVGLIHGDFNEFNIMVRDEDEEEDDDDDESGEDGTNAEREGKQGKEVDSDAKATARIKPVVIDFPQMVSIDHANAAMYFDRDVNCIKAFFKRRFGFTSEQPGPFFADAKKSAGKAARKRLDIEAEASGFSKKMAKELEKYMEDVGANGGDDYNEHNDGWVQVSDDDEESRDDNGGVPNHRSRDHDSKSDKVPKGSSHFPMQGISLLSVEEG